MDRFSDQRRRAARRRIAQSAAGPQGLRQEARGGSAINPIVAVECLSKSFGMTRALDDVSVAVARGTAHGFIGPNGSGKSTLIRMLTGLERPDRGQVLLDGAPQTAFSGAVARKAGIELSPQELALVPLFKVWENVVLGSEPNAIRVSPSESRAVARKVLDELGLDIGVDEDTLTLDPGEQRLIMFARTFHRNARLLIADEPTAGLGEKDSRTVIDALKRLKAKSVSMIFVSHHLSEVLEICDEVTVMRDGRVAARLQGPTLTLDRMIGEMSGVHAQRAITPRDFGRKSKMIIEGRHLAMPPLRQLNFKLYENECLGFAGLLGSGREKAVDVISGAARLWGSVRVRGEFIETPREAVVAGVGLMNGSRSSAIVPGWSVLKHVSLPSLEQSSRYGLINGRRERAAAESATRRLRVKASLDDDLADLSGGNQQRALLSRWLMCGSNVLLIDEPCVGVDIAARTELLAAIRDFAQVNSVIVASSDPEDLVECCDRVLCLRKGVVVKELVGDEITEEAILRSTMTSAAKTAERS
jgi:ABC-type sugar transport system ATPase subunit